MHAVCMNAGLRINLDRIARCVASIHMQLAAGNLAIEIVHFLTSFLTSPSNPIVDLSPISNYKDYKNNP